MTLIETVMLAHGYFDRALASFTTASLDHAVLAAPAVPRRRLAALRHRRARAREARAG